MDKINEMKKYLDEFEKIIANIEAKKTYNDMDKSDLRRVVQNLQDLIEKSDGTITYVEQ